MSGPEPAESDVAIVGMSGRFPGAPDVDLIRTYLTESKT